MSAAAYVNGTWRCYSTTNGITRHYLGCRHLIPRSAVAHTSSTYVLPLRASTEASTADPRTPPDGRVRSDASVEWRKRVSGLKDRPAK